MTLKQDLDLIEEIRSTSRSLAREWGFMGGEFAGTDLSPSAVHALLEVDKGGATARSIGDALHLEKSTVSRMLHRLVLSGDVLENPRREDARIKELSLTSSGRKRVARIHSYARAQVLGALDRLSKQDVETVIEGMRLYDAALRGARLVPDLSSSIQITTNFRVGLIAQITQLHATYYARETGFGQQFESVVASGLAEFCNRIENSSNGIWTGVRDGKIVGSVVIDGEDLGDGIAHLRWFIVDDSTRGTGLGRALLTHAMEFVDNQDFSETHLWTFRGLHAARHLYETLGFVLVKESQGKRWGGEVMEQLFVRKKH